MFFAIVERYTDIDYRVSGQRTASQEFVNAFIDRRNMLSGDHTTYDRVDELVSFTTFAWAKLDRDLAELASTARLLFVTIPGIRRRFDRLTEWNARLYNFDIYLKAFS